MSHSASALVRAIALLDVVGVEKMMAAGLNPYQAGVDGQNALDAWSQSQQLGNPYAERMAKALLSRGPSNLEESQVLKGVIDKQLRNIGQAMGVREYGRTVGLDDESAYIPPQSLESAQACWSAVQQASHQYLGASPDISASDYAWHVAAGFEHARQCLVPENGLARMRDLQGVSINPDPVLAHQFETMIQRLGEQIHVLPSGAISAHAQGPGQCVSVVGLQPEATYSAKALEQPQIAEIAVQAHDKYEDRRAPEQLSIASWRSGRQQAPSTSVSLGAGPKL